MSGDSSDVPPALGARNPRIAALRRTIRRSGARAPQIVLEGVRTTNEALDACVELEILVVAQRGAGDEHVNDTVRRVSGSTEVVTIPDHVFDRLAPSTTPQPVLAIATRPIAGLPDRIDDGDLVLVLVDVSDPGNLGTILRVADACAAACVVVVGGADPWGPKANRASAGSVVRVPIVQCDSLDEVLDRLRGADATIVATDVRDGVAHDSGVLGPDPTRRGGLALVLGSEAHGLSRSIAPNVDHWVRIGMLGRTESLNVAMAATLLAFEVRR